MRPRVAGQAPLPRRPRGHRDCHRRPGVAVGGVSVRGRKNLQAIDNLARLRTPSGLGDSGVRLHALASLIAQAERLLPVAVHDARDQELTWAQIGELLNTTAATAARRYRNKQ